MPLYEIDFNARFYNLFVEIEAASREEAVQRLMGMALEELMPILSRDSAEADLDVEEVRKSRPNGKAHKESRIGAVGRAP